MAQKRKPEREHGFFRENLGMLAVLLLPLLLGLVGITGMMLHEYSYGFRTWWAGLWTFEQDSAAKRAAKPVVPKNPYRARHVEECKDMAGHYVIENSGDPDPVDVTTAIGLPPDADADAIQERCVAFARTVYKMEELSSHPHHAFLCDGARFSVGRDFGFIPAPDGDGLFLTSNQENAKEMFVPLGAGELTIYRQWELYNMGDGCFVVGYSSRNSRVLEVFEPAE